MANGVQDTDRGYKALLATLRSIDGVEITVGIPQDAGEDLIVYAAAQEFGTDTIPERSYLRATLAMNSKTYQKLLRRALMKTLRTGTPFVFTARDVAKRMEQDIKTRIYAGIQPPLEPETIAAKGSSTPLIDTGRLVQSITSQVTQTKR